jgi:predicted permease
VRIERLALRSLVCGRNAPQLPRPVFAPGTLIQITIFEAAMAPMIGASIVAQDHKLDPQLITLMVGIGIPLSFLTLPVWWYALQGV